MEAGSTSAASEAGGTQPLSVLGAALLKALPMPAFVKDSRGVHLLCNEAFCVLIERLESEIVGHTTGEVYPSDTARRASETDRLVFDTGLPQHYETSMVDKAGRRRVGLVSKAPFSPPGSGETWIVGCIQDITQRREFEEVLDSQHQLLRTLIDNLPQLIFAKDREGRFTLANKAVAQRMTGQGDPEKVIGKHDSDFYPPDLWVSYDANDREVIRSGIPRYNELEPNRDTDGRVRWNITTKVPIRGEGGEVEGLIGICTDVTQMKRTEEQLRLQATALENAADGIYITDREGRILWANSSMGRISGYSMAELIGATSKLLDCGMHTAGFFDELWKTLLGGQPWSGEIICRRKNGEVFTGETAITPVPDESGQISHFVAIQRDISPRKLLEEEMFRIYSAVAGALDGILLVSPENKPLFANKAFTSLLGYTLKDLPPQVFEQMAVHEDPGQSSGGLTTTSQIDLPASGGRVVPLEIRSWSVIGASGVNFGRVFFLRDLSDERRRHKEQTLMEVRLRQAQKLEAIGQLAAGIAHEINTPIQFVGGNVSFLQGVFGDLLRLVDAQRAVIERSSTPEDRRGIELLCEEIELDYIRDEVPTTFSQSTEGIQRISDIVKAMKDFSHPGTKSRRHMNLNKAVNDAVIVARNEWKYHSEVTVELDPALPTVPALPGEVNQVLLNILVNASHAVTDAVTKGLRERGQISIRTEHDTREARVRIRDNGTGIPADIQHRVFEPFFTTKEVGKGTGQGLTIAYDVIVRKHGGQLSFDSRPGEGTEFIIALPLQPDGEETRE